MLDIYILHLIFSIFTCLQRSNIEEVDPLEFLLKRSQNSFLAKTYLHPLYFRVAHD